MENTKEIQVDFEQVKPIKRINWVVILGFVWVVLFNLYIVNVVSFNLMATPIILIWCYILIEFIRSL